MRELDRAKIAMYFPLSITTYQESAKDQMVEHKGLGWPEVEKEAPKTNKMESP